MPRKKPGSLQRRQRRDRDDGAVTSQHVELSEFTSGPLPHPKFYGGYEQVLPGSANRIMGMAEEEGQQRRIRKMILTVAVAVAVVSGVTVGGFLLYRGENLEAGLSVVGASAIAFAFKDRLR